MSANSFAPKHLTSSCSACVAPRRHAVPETRFIEVPGAGHLMQEDAPEAIVAALADFPPLAFASGQ